MFNPKPERQRPSKRTTTSGRERGLEFRSTICCARKRRRNEKIPRPLRPLERRLVVGVTVVLVLVLNGAFIWPHFSDWASWARLDARRAS